MNEYVFPATASRADEADVSGLPRVMKLSAEELANVDALQAVPRISQSELDVLRRNRRSR